MATGRRVRLRYQLAPEGDAVQSSITVANFTNLDELMDAEVVADSGAEVESMLIAAVEKSRAVHATGQNDWAHGAARPFRTEQICRY